MCIEEVGKEHVLWLSLFTRITERDGFYSLAKTILGKKKRDIHTAADRESHLSFSFRYENKYISC